MDGASFHQPFGMLLVGFTAVAERLCSQLDETIVQFTMGKVEPFGHGQKGTCARMESRNTDLG